MFLNSIEAADNDDSSPNRNYSEVLYVFDKLLTRFILLNSDVSGVLLLKWLNIRRKITDHYPARIEDELKKALTANAGLRKRLVDTAIIELKIDDANYGFIWDLLEKSLHCLDERLIIERIMSLLDQIDNDDKKYILYELAVMRACRQSPEEYPLFERCYEYATGNKTLEDIRSRRCFSPIDEWEAKASQRKLELSIEESIRRTKLQSNFEKCSEQIGSGTHLKWLETISLIYFEFVRGVEGIPEPHERLCIELGEDNSLIALRGLANLVQGKAITSLQEIIQMQIESKRYNWWYAVIAGLDEYINAGKSTDDLLDDYLRSVFAIDCLHPTSRNADTTEHTWKDEVLRKRPSLVAETYFALIRSDLEHQAHHTHGLYEFMHNEYLKAFRADAALKLLDLFPATSANNLQYLFPAALECEDKSSLLGLIDKGLRYCKLEEKTDSFIQWLAIGFFIDFYRVAVEIDNLNDEAARKLVWALRDHGGFNWHANPHGRPVTTEQCQYLVGFVGRFFPNTPRPSGTTHGDTNPRDATEFILKLINIIAGDVSTQATDALSTLKALPYMTSYRNDIKHALASQKKIQVDSAFKQPSWKEVVDALKNGIPANISDLQELTLSHLNDLKSYIATAPTNIYEQFWSEKPLTPKVENSCRNALIELLRPRLSPLSIRVEPEVHLAGEKRVDIAATVPGMKLVIELKRDFHGEVWTACQEQLDRFYTRDPEAKGYGIYGVFWYGEKRGGQIPKPPNSLARPQSSAEMERQLQSLIPPENQHRLKVIVIDVSGVH